jgi:hypothetical protein
MKKLLAILALAGILTAAVIWLIPSRPSAPPPPQVDQLKAELAEREQKIQELEAERKRAETQVRELARLSDDIAAQNLAREAALSNALATRDTARAETTSTNAEGGFGKMLAGIMKDPEMRKMIREQQSAALNQLYEPLIKRLQLTPEEAQKFSDILAGGMESGMELASSMFGGGDATNRTALAKSIAAQQEEQKNQMKALLGEERYAQYEDYQQTVGERAQLSQFRQQMGAGAINDDQAEALLGIMREEKKNVAATSGTAFPGQNSADIDAMLKEGQVEKLLAAQETVNQNVYARAGTVLSPEQLASFGKHQTNQLQMMRMGLNMARRFMGSDGTPPK